MFITKGAVIKEKSNDDLYGLDVTTKAAMQIGFWLILVADIAVVVYTLFRDFAINKETINEKGLKAAMTGVKDSVSNDLFGGGKVCPNCGNTVSAGKKFCLKCGAKVIEDMENTGIRKADRTAVRIPDKIITVNEYIKSMKEITCPKCGISIAANSKFCPDCGETVVLKIKPDKCIKCGNPVVNGKIYCGDCGSRITDIELVKKCPECNAELLYLKPYCVECGRKIY